MLVAIAFAALAVQGQAPMVPTSCSPSFQATVLSVEECLQKGDFATAEVRLKLLPKLALTIDWDDTKVPAAFRPLFRKAGEQAISAWTGRLPGLKIDYNSKADIRISFEPVLAKRPDTDFPAGHVGFWSEEPDSPRLDFVIGLKRGSPLVGTEETDVFDDVAYCVGSYLGLADGVTTADSMAPTDLPRSYRTSVSGREFGTARANLQVVRQLAIAVRDKTPLTPTKADLFVDPMVLTSEPSTQGDRIEFHVQLTNRGNGPLAFSMSPDCGCTVVTDPGTVNPESSRIVSFAVDTTNFIGNVTKHVAIFTNDPVTPVRVVTLNVRLKPRYRLIVPMGDTVVVPNTGLKYPVYLIPAPGTSLDPVSLTFDGTIPAKTSFAPWQGVLADPEMGEGPKLRKGYKIVVAIDGSIRQGRNLATLDILTANSEFPNIQWAVTAQKGIVALPEVISMGEVGRVPKTSHFLVSRPNVPFKIIGLTSNSQNVKASVVPGTSQDTYSIEVQYDGNGQPGDLEAAIKVKTDDPHQPIIDVPVSATIR